MINKKKKVKFYKKKLAIQLNLMTLTNCKYNHIKNHKF